MMRRGFFLAACAALAACAGPRQEAPATAHVVAPPAWRVAASSGPLPAAWWRAFDDAALTALIDEALENNDDLALAAVRVRAARADLGYAQAQRRPDIQAALEGGRNRSVNPGFGVIEEQTAGQALVQASYDVDLFGRLKAASAAAQSALLATEDAQETVRLGVAATVAGSYYALLALDARLAIARDTLAVRRQELQLEQERRAAGYSTSLDLVRAQAELEGTSQLIPTLLLAIANTENGLSILLGRAPGPVARAAGFDRPAPDVPVALPAALLRRRPDIAAAEARMAATDHALDAARAAFLPDIRLAATGGFVGSTLVDASPARVWSAGASILAPLFDAGRLRAQQDGATARRDEAAYAYRKTALQAFREVEDGLAATTAHRERFDSLARQQLILARSLALATRRYREGHAGYLDQLEAQRGLLSTQLALVQARQDRYDAAISLVQALGGGWAP